MTLSTENIKKTATLARIKLEAEALTFWQNELSGILKWIDQLQKVPTSGVENYSDIQSEGMLERTDEINDGNYVTDVLANAPESAHTMFAVPKVIE